MTRYSFTGTASLQPEHFAVARTLVRARTDGTEFTTGAQFGFDMLACAEALFAFPEALHRVVVPQAPHDEEGVQWAYEHGALIVQAPAGKPTKSDPRGHRAAYRNRNLLVVEYGDVLVGCARGPERSLPYSGTWATIRLGRAAGLPVIVKILGSRPSRGGILVTLPPRRDAATDRPHEAVDVNQEGVTHE